MTRTDMAVLVFSLAVAGCGESATRPSGPIASGGPTFDVGTEEAATGGRASGHEAIIVVDVITEKTSFIALSTAPFPTAKGELEHHVTAPGLTGELHGDVDCLVIVGKEAILSGSVESYVVNGVTIPALQFILRVEDNSEGTNSPPDRASQINVLAPPNFPFPIPDLCESQVLVPEPLFPTQEGNIQVQPEQGV
jgi:hypothetical protein